MEKLLQRSVTMELHEVTLVEYYRLQMIPRGLRVCLVPTIFSQNVDFKTNVCPDCKQVLVRYNDFDGSIPTTGASGD